MCRYMRDNVVGLKRKDRTFVGTRHVIVCVRRYNVIEKKKKMFLSVGHPNRVYGVLVFFTPRRVNLKDVYSFDT